MRSAHPHARTAARADIYRCKWGGAPLSYCAGLATTNKWAAAFSSYMCVAQLYVACRSTTLTLYTDHCTVRV